MRLPSASALAALLATALIAAGCGDSGNGGSASPAVNNAVDKCVEQAKSIKDADSRRTATEACKAAKTGDTGKVKDAARQQCLDQAKQLSDAQAKKTLQERCKAIK
jgi:hypothetical protein